MLAADELTRLGSFIGSRIDIAQHWDLTGVDYLYLELFPCAEHAVNWAASERAQARRK